MVLRKTMWKRGTLLVMAAVLLSVNAGALFGWGAKEEMVSGIPEAIDITCETYQGVSCHGQLQGSGENGEELNFALAKEPGKGTVTLEENRFIYTPRVTATGTDRFTYVVVDAHGNSSAPATAEIRIQRTRSGVTYADLEGSDAAVAAQHLAEEGVFVGAKLGENYYFEPDREVLRSEFLAMAMETVGREVTAVTMTGFCDDAVIPTWAKAYAAAGVAEGIVQGSMTEAGSAFRGGEAITFNEAATVLDRVLGLEDVDLQAWYVDRDAVPSWAAQAVANMESVQVMAAGSFGSHTMEEPVRRADAARMLSAVRTLLEGDGPKGLQEMK